jgi:hypothetical protein
MGCKIEKPESCDTMGHGSSVDKSAGCVSSSGLHGGLHGRHHQYACGPCWNGKLLQWLVTTTSLTRSGLLVCDAGGIFGLRMEVEHSTSGVTPPCTSSGHPDLADIWTRWMLHSSIISQSCFSRNRCRQRPDARISDDLATSVHGRRSGELETGSFSPRKRGSEDKQASRVSKSLFDTSPSS